MSMSMFTVILLVFYMLIPTGVLSIAEYFLARLESPWPGRVLPILSAACSVCVAALLLFNLMAGPWTVLFIPLLALAVFNIPTAVFLLVYFTTRRKYAERRNMDRMDVQDL